MLFHNNTNVADNIVRASFIISKKIAKYSKPYSEDECPEKSHEMQKISLSRWTIT